MKVLNFLYYTIYKGFSLVKRDGIRNEDLATIFFSILLSTNTVMLLFSLRFIIPKGTFTPLIPNLLLRIFLIVILIGLYLLCRKYYIKEKNDFLIISYYDNKYPARKNQFIAIGILYSIGTFISFMCAAYIVSRL